jgi:hypothetical protein
LCADTPKLVFTTLGSVVPDLRWTIEDIRTFGDQIVVRGEATGTPVREFWGAKPTGKSFKTMAIDVFTVKNGKLASAYHVENCALHRHVVLARNRLVKGGVDGLPSHLTCSSTPQKRVVVARLGRALRSPCREPEPRASDSRMVPSRHAANGLCME